MTRGLGASADADQALAVPATPLRVDGPSGFDPSRWMKRTGLRREWVRDSVTAESGAMAARRYGAPFEWGLPIATYTWTKETWRNEWDCSAITKAIACLFANGRVVDIRFGSRGTKTSFYSALASVDRSPEGQDAQRLDRNDESAVRDSADAQDQSP